MAKTILQQIDDIIYEDCVLPGIRMILQDMQDRIDEGFYDEMAPETVDE